MHWDLMRGNGILVQRNRISTASANPQSLWALVSPSMYLSLCSSNYTALFNECKAASGLHLFISYFKHYWVVWNISLNISCSLLEIFHNVSCVWSIWSLSTHTGHTGVFVQSTIYSQWRPINRGRRGAAPPEEEDRNHLYISLIYL